ncbi:uncharacterized protein B0H64DRAFT_111845 [Chaetomium fimeti]|uniref:Uncharacterized protein n=1 Tax=Chaetomium fimeti TaxID=1854472 RepID=A0AAE0HHW0_9PEZI|nr:hypothetical protein B0H64DRAFT_111845 [Chaetomium fimeti]
MDIPREDPKYTKALAKVSDHMIDVRMLLKELALVDELKNATDGIICLRDILEGNRIMWRDFSDAMEEALSSLSSPMEMERFHSRRQSLREARAQNEHMLGQASSLQQKAYTNPEYLQDLVEFKQAQSNLMESHFARRQAEATSRQGNIIMFFTFMTIFFVSVTRVPKAKLSQRNSIDLQNVHSSLSLMATFFTLNVTTFPKDDAGEVEFGLGYVCWNIGKLSHSVHSTKLLINLCQSSGASSSRRPSCWSRPS